MTLLGRHKQDAWEQWVDEHLDALMLYAKWQTRSQSDAEDVLQWVLERTWSAFKKQGPADIYALVCKKIRLRAVDFYRMQKRRETRELQYGEFSVVQSSDDEEQRWFTNFTEAKELQAILLAELHRLAEDLQEVVILHTWNELSFREIAEVIELPKSTVADRYKRAIEALKIKLEGEQRICP